MGTQTISKAEAKVFVISAIALSVTVCNAAFWYGVFGKVFFTQVLYIWAAATAALLASLFVPRIASPLLRLPWRGRFILALPTVWLVLTALVDLEDLENFDTFSFDVWVLWALTLASAFLTLPYLLYVIIVAVVPDIDRLTHRNLRIALPAIVLLMGVAGFVLGKHHTYFLTCENFKLGGHNVPENCRRVSGS